ncbi:glycosyltransferase [Flavobacterium sp.]|uniref:glycosyltransferase n=1 Tax=Flavobacterium sp. TaxID=239 RepID=UPI0037522A2E
MQKKRILFLGETFRADAITWMNGLKEFGDFEIVTWELQNHSEGISRIKRLFELFKIFFNFKKIAKSFNADMVIAERVTSYGFLAAISGIKAIAIAQQGSSDLWPENSPLYFFKKKLQNYAFKKANIIHAWGNIMAVHMQKHKADMSKVMIMPKGINVDLFAFQNNSSKTKINAIVTRSLKSEYKQDAILKAFSILKKKNISFELIIVGDGLLLEKLKKLAIQLNIEKEVVFAGRINNIDLPKLLQESNFYISMPTTEGVSASLFEAMACGCFPVVSNIEGNQNWIKHNVNGILAESENAEKLAYEIEKAFLNPDLIKKAIIENRKFVVENANYAINMKKIANAYHELINRTTI